MEEARGFQKLVDDFGFRTDDVAEAVGKSRSHIANMIRLLALPQSVQNMVVDGTLTPGHARALINAKNPTLLAQEVMQKGLSVRQTEKLAADNAGEAYQARGGKASKGGPTFKDPNILSLEKDLTNALGLKVVIAMKGNTDGTLSIDFKTLDQLDDVMLRLSKIPKVID